MRIIVLLIMIIILAAGCSNQEKTDAVKQNETIRKEQTNNTEVIESNKTEPVIENKSMDILNNITVSKPNESIVQINTTSNISFNQTVKINQTNQSSSAPVISDKFIIANPFDFSQASVISKFRSCVGHDYSGIISEGKQETKRSMKHYIDAISSLKGSSGRIKVFAPFNGSIIHIDQDFVSFEGKQRGVQVWISNPYSDGWLFVFFHIDSLPSVKKGSDVKAGELIGYANVNGGENFDITLKKFVFPNFDPSMFDQKEKSNYVGVEGSANVLTSPFLHMTPEVLKQYKSKGLKVDDFIISKPSRDLNPCTCINEECTFPSSNPTSNPEDWVILN